MDDERVDAHTPPVEAQAATTSDPPETTTGAAVVVLQGVSIRLGERLVWQDATLSIAAGEFVAIVGPNGSGKSTLLRLVLGLLRPTAGSIRVFGAPPRRGNPAIGYLPQYRALRLDWNACGRDIVALGVDGHRWGFALPGAAQRRKRALVEDALSAVGATAYADQPLSQLSGGEQQRLWLAQALVGHPRLLLLDEPFANLDLRSQSAIARLITDLGRAQGITMLLVTHDVNPLLRVVDRVLYVAHGQIAIGAPAEIVTTERLSRLYEAPVEVVRDSRGQMFVVGLEEEVAHPHRP